MLQIAELSPERLEAANGGRSAVAARLTTWTRRACKSMLPTVMLYTSPGRSPQPYINQQAARCRALVTTATKGMNSSGVMWCHGLPLGLICSGEFPEVLGAWNGLASA